MEPRLPLERRNWTVIGAAIAMIILGFFLLSQGDVTAAPFLLVLGYCVLIPVGILLPPRGTRSQNDTVGRTGVGE
jgi:uncharacterized membrane protein HdeD (DUF308 family)